MTYQFKNLLLAYPSDWMVDANTLDLAKKTIPVLQKFFDQSGDCEMEELPLKEAISEPLKEVYTVPFLSEKFCKILMDEIPHMAKQLGFEPNPDEDELRQIPEIVLQEKLPELWSSIMVLVQNILNPVFLTTWQRMIDAGGIQIANYKPEGKRKGAWHHDKSADITVVVPLNTGEYEGGGTEFLGRGTVPPLPTGSALIFPGLTHMHRGLEVLSGDRYLLVFWLKCKEEEDED